MEFSIIVGAKLIVTCEVQRNCLPVLFQQVVCSATVRVR